MPWQQFVSKYIGTDKRARQYSRVVELLAFALIVPLAGLVLFPQDPTGLTSGFPWVAAPPLVFTVRHGCAWGVSCAAIMAAFVNLPLMDYAHMASAHAALGLGTIALCLIVGDISSAIIKRFASCEAENTYLRHRLKVFSTDYHMLKVSHEQLEQCMAGHHLSLREALRKLKARLNEEAGLQAGSELLAVFSRFCSIQVAGLYVSTDNGRVDTDPLSTHGYMPPLSEFDPVLRMAIQEKQLVSIRHDKLENRDKTQGLLAAIPLVDSEYRLHGVIAVQKMHFMAFEQQTLDVMALLGSCIGDILSRTPGAGQSPVDHFLAEVQTSLHFASQHHTQSVMLSLQFEPSDQGLQVARFVCEGVRNLDASWLSCDNQQSPVVCLLFPLMSVAAGHAFLQRLDTAVNEEFNIHLSHILQDSQIRSVTSRDTLDSCKAFFSVHVCNTAFDSQADSAEFKGAA